MKLEHLKYLLAVSRRGSMSQAAKELFIAQPYLSKCIRELEAELNITIFIRQKDGVVLTGQGRQFMLHAARLVNEMDNLMRLYEPGSQSITEFSVSTVRSSLIMDCFLQLLDENRECPRTNFHIHEGGNDMVINDVYTQTSSLGIVQIHHAQYNDFLTRLKSKNLKYRQIQVLDRQIILSRSHPLLASGKPIVTEDLYNYGLVRYGEGLLFGSTSADDLWYNTFFDPNNIARQIYVYDRASLHNILTQTDYFTVGTDPSLRQEEVHNIVSVPLSDDRHISNLKAEMGYIYLNEQLLSPTAKQFAKLLLNAYAKI